MAHSYSWERPSLKIQSFYYDPNPPSNLACSLTPTTSDVHLQQQAPFCFSRQNSVNNSHPQPETIPPHLCNYTSHLSFPSGWSVYHVSGTAGHSFAFSGRLPSTPLVGATLVSSLSVSETTDKFPERLLFAMDFSCCLLTAGLFFLCGAMAYLCLPINWTGTSALVYLTPDTSIAPNNQTLHIPLTHNQPQMGNSIHFSVDQFRNSGRDWDRDRRTHNLFKLLPRPF